MNSGGLSGRLFLSGVCVDLQIDHVTVCGRDLDRMRQSFAERGLATEYGGPHANGLTHMALAGFDDGSYLELIAPLSSHDQGTLQPTSGMMAGWLPLMLGDAGSGAWAIRAHRIHDLVSQLRQRGIAVRGPERGGRKKPDGTQLEWETALLGSEPAGSLLPFLIEDHTDRKWRVEPSAAVRKAGFRGVCAVILAVENIAASAALFQSAFGWDFPAEMEDPRFAAKLAHFSGTPVILATPLRSSSVVRARLDRFGQGPLGILFSGTLPEPSPQTSHWFGQRIVWFQQTSDTDLLGIVDAT
jgi:Glyoxalase-like domain